MTTASVVNGRVGLAVTDSGLGIAPEHHARLFDRFYDDEQRRDQVRERVAADGEEVVIRVPCGTVLYRGDEDQPLGDLVEPGQRLLIARGGAGGQARRGKHRLPRRGRRARGRGRGRRRGG